MRKFKKHNENDDHKNLGNLKFKLRAQKETGEIPCVRREAGCIKK